MCEPRFSPPDARDANFDAGEVADASRDVSIDTPLPLRDAPNDSDPDTVPWVPSTDASELANALNLRVASASAPTSDDGAPWDPDGTPPDLRVEVETTAGVVLQTSIATDSYSTVFTDDATTRINVGEPLRFTLRDIDELTPTGMRSTIIIACEPRASDELRTRGGLLQCKEGDATIEVQAEPVFSE